MNDRTTRVCLAVAIALVAVGAFHLAVFLVDDRPWDGPVSWRKPADFGIAFGLNLAAIALVTTRFQITAGRRAFLLGILAVDSVLEVGGITLQAWRGVPSHLNRSTPFDAAVATMLAVGGAVLIVVVGALAADTLRGRVSGPPSMQLAIRAGFLFLVIGLFAGAVMIAAGTVVMRSGDTERAYHDAGFLKTFHAVTLNAVIALPALAWWLGRRSTDEHSCRRAVRIATVVWATAAAAALVIDLATI